MKKQFINIAESDLVLVLNYVLHIPNRPRIITLKGEVGAGKTTFVRALVKALGAVDTVSSPTFSLINEYKTKDNAYIYHSDWYRIKETSELLDLGIEDYIYSDHILIIEWPEIGTTLLKGETVLEIAILHENKGRTYNIETISL